MYLKLDIYETDDDYSLEQIQIIEKFLDDNIGTEYERNECPMENCYYVLVFEITQEEVDKIREFEIEFRKRIGKCKYLID